MSESSNKQRLADHLAAISARGEGIFMPFVVIGDPDLDVSMEIASCLVEAGADVMEFGFPFSDPPADGPVIQAADDRALKAGVTPTDCLAFIAAFTQKHDVPVALLIYFNLIMQRGVDRFYEEAAAAGVNAVLVADVPIEAAGPLLEAGQKHGIAPIFIASELSSPQRLEQVAAVAEGYIYAVARIGITGEQKALNSGLSATLARIGAATELPVFAGFGISTPQHVKDVLTAGADGAICGSAIVRRIEKYVTGERSKAEMLADLRQFSASMKDATRPGHTS